MGEIRKPRVESVTRFLRENADRNLTYTEIEEQTGCPRGSLSSAIARLAQVDNRVDRVAKGVVRYHSSVPAIKKGEALLIELIKDDGEKRLVQDEQGNVWVMKKLGDY